MTKDEHLQWWHRRIRRCRMDPTDFRVESRAQSVRNSVWRAGTIVKSCTDTSSFRIQAIIGRNRNGALHTNYPWAADGMVK